MFERFTDRARKIMALANQECQRLNHEYIGTEHILLGLAKEGNGVGCAALKKLGVSLDDIIANVNKLVRKGPEMVTMGRLPQTPRAKKIVEYAIEQAKGLGHNYVGSEHILLGILQEHDGVAAQILMNMGVTIDKTKTAIVQVLTDSDDGITDEVRRIAESVLGYKVAQENNARKQEENAILHQRLEEAITLSSQAGLDIVAAFAQVMADHRPG
tara:strand:+ start:81048 stop:81689 length:642 start_codon:yes stop_codon:yes gene_type:complete